MDTLMYKQILLKLSLRNLIVKKVSNEEVKKVSNEEYPENILHQILSFRLADTKEIRHNALLPDADLDTGLHTQTRTQNYSHHL